MITVHPSATITLAHAHAAVSLRPSFPGFYSYTFAQSEQSLQEAGLILCPRKGVFRDQLTVHLFTLGTDPGCHQLHFRAQGLQTHNKHMVVTEVLFLTDQAVIAQFDHRRYQFFRNNQVFLKSSFVSEDKTVVQDQGMSGLTAPNFQLNLQDKGSYKLRHHLVWAVLLIIVAFILNLIK